MFLPCWTRDQECSCTKKYSHINGHSDSKYVLAVVRDITKEPYLGLYVRNFHSQRVKCGRVSLHTGAAAGAELLSLVEGLVALDDNDLLDPTFLSEMIENPNDIHSNVLFKLLLPLLPNCLFLEVEELQGFSYFSYMIWRAGNIGFPFPTKFEHFYRRREGNNSIVVATSSLITICS